MYLPIGLLGVSIATAVLPVAARHAAIEDRAAIRETVSRGLGLMMLLNIPATVGLVVLAQPIVRVLFERGRFLPLDTAATAIALQMYAIGLMGYATARIASPVFYALGRSRVAVTISAGAVVLNVAFSMWLVQPLGFKGLALATSIAALAHGGIALFVLRRYLMGIDGVRLGSRIARVTIAAACMAFAVIAVERWTNLLLPGASLVAQSVRLGSTILVGVCAFGLIAWLLGIRDIGHAVATITSRNKQTRDR
jgi:putative peptidoglycan lipid II flippase